MIYDVKVIEEIGKTESNKVVLLNSGGLESCYLACLLSKCGFDIHHVFIDYGQNALEGETLAVKNIVHKYGGTLHEVKINLPWLASSTSICSGATIGDPIVSSNYMSTIEGNTYVPLRNHVFLSIAGSLADSLEIPYIASGLDGIQDCFGVPIGSAPDKHPDFARAIEESINEASGFNHAKGGYIEVLAPILCCTKEDTIRNGKNIDCDFSISWSCYNKGSKPCGTCCACADRKSHFDNLGIIEENFNIITQPA